MKHRILRNHPAVNFGEISKADELYEIHYYRQDGKGYTVYLAEYHARGDETEVFTTDSAVEAQKHFHAVSEGTETPMYHLNMFLETAYPERLQVEVDKATLDIFEPPIGYTNVEKLT